MKNIPDPKILELENDYYHVKVSTMGAAIHQLYRQPRTLNPAKRGFSILREMPKEITDVRESGLFPLLPFANRIRGNTFQWRGQKITWPKHAFDPEFFLHGDGWIKTWECIDFSDTHCVLRLESDILNVCHYRAILCYTLVADRFEASLSIENLADQTFPFGLGFHPFFNIDDNTMLQFDYTGFWEEDACHLPRGYLKKANSPFDFSNAQKIADQWLNNGYDHWQGCAILTHLTGVRVILESDCNVLQLFQPGNMGQNRFICLEPQSHPVDAHNNLQYPGLACLAKGEVFTVNMRIRCEE